MNIKAPKNAQAFFIAWAFFSFLFLTSCGDAEKSGGLFVYRLAEKMTAKTENTIFFETFGGTFLYSINGEGFSASETLGEQHPINGQVTLHFEEFRNYSLNLTVYQSDGTEFISDEIKWTRSNMTPNDPVLSFSEKSTNDPYVKLLFVPNHKPLTNQIWIEGDLAQENHPEGKWYDLPKINKLGLTLTAEDGEKVIRVKYRNEIGIESTLKEASIIKDSIPPQNCKSEPVAEYTASGTIKFRVFAKDAQKTYYRVYGDIRSNSDFTAFDKSAIFKVDLKLDNSTTIAEKRVMIQIKDEADNYCPPMEHFITFDPDYEPSYVQIENNAIWTNQEEVQIKLHYDHFESEEIEMLIEGGVIADESTFQWIPYSEDLLVSLEPHEGNRFIYARFREVTTGVKTRSVHTPIYLRPQAYYLKSANPDRIALAQIVGLTGITITGCGEKYQRIEPINMVSCTPLSDEISVIYHLEDGSNLEKILSSQ